MHCSCTQLCSGEYSRIVELIKEWALTDQEKYHLLTNHFTPSASYTFPAVPYEKQNCCFQYSWFSQYNGLVYSQIERRGYCKYCILLGQALPLYSTSPALWSHTHSPIFRRQMRSCESTSHALVAISSKIPSGSCWKRQKISRQWLKESRCQLTNNRQAFEQSAFQNREKLKSIAETVILCGRQGISLRGHRDDRRHLEVTIWQSWQFNGST